MAVTVTVFPEGTDFYRDICSECKRKRRIKAFGGGLQGWINNENRFRGTARR